MNLEVNGEGLKTVVSESLENLKLILCHGAIESNQGGATEFTLSTINTETKMVLQELKFRHDSYDEARLLAKRYKELLICNTLEGSRI